MSAAEKVLALDKFWWRCGSQYLGFLERGQVSGLGIKIKWVVESHINLTRFRPTIIVPENGIVDFLGWGLIVIVELSTLYQITTKLYHPYDTSDWFSLKIFCYFTQKALKILAKYISIQYLDSIIGSIVDTRGFKK